jgi:hypothetical protein
MHAADGPVRAQFRALAERLAESRAQELAVRVTVAPTPEATIES